MVDVPAATPVTMPDDAPMVAVDVLTDVHVPPASPVALLKVVVLVAQTLAVPVTTPALGDGLTVTITVAAEVPQPLVTV